VNVTTNEFTTPKKFEDDISEYYRKRNAEYKNDESAKSNVD